MIMRGGTELRRILNDYLSATMPGVIAVMRDHYDLDQYSLPNPNKYDAIDPTTVDNNDYPAVGCVVINDRGHARVDIDELAQQEYSPTYVVRFVVVARTPSKADGNWELPGKATAVRLRDDLTRALHHVLLSNPGLNLPSQVKFNEGVMSTDYLEPFQASTQAAARWIAASLVNTEVQFTEKTWLVPFGEAETISIQEEILNP